MKKRKKSQPEEKEKKQQLREAFGDQVKLSFFPRKDREAFIKGLETADALLLDGDIDDLVLTGKNLKWIHCDHSGLTYSARPEVNDKFETKVKGLFVGGDGAGITRGLAQAGASGVWVARQILERYDA